MVSLIAASSLIAAFASSSLGGIAQPEVPEQKVAEAPAATEARVDLNPQSPWTIELHPGVWYAGFAGDLRMPRQGGGSGTVSAQSLDMSTPRVTPYGEVNLAKGNWLIEARGFAFGADARGTPDVTTPLGDLDLTTSSSVSTSLDITGIELEGGYRFISYEAGKTERGGSKLRFDATGLVGVRMLDVGTTVSLPDGGTGVLTDTEEELAVHPLIGIKLKADLYEDFTIHFEMNGGWFGGSTESSGFDIVVGGQWRPFRNVGLQVGYRALFFELVAGDDENEFEWGSASLQGLYGGITLNF